MQTKTRAAPLGVCAVAPPLPDFSQERRTIDETAVIDIISTAATALAGIVSMAKGALAVMTSPGPQSDIAAVATLINEIWVRAELGESHIISMAVDTGIAEEEYNDPYSIRVTNKYRDAIMGAAVCLPTPAIGTYWEGQGGIYRGIAVAENGAPAAHLIQAVQQPDAPDANDQAQAIEWARQVTCEGQDFHLCTRREALQLVAGGLVPGAWFWTSSNDRPGTGWFVDESGGLDVHDCDNAGSAIAVRRIPITGAC